MIGDNFLISVGLSKSVALDLIQETLLSLKDAHNVRPDTMNIEKKEPELIDVDNDCIFKAFYNRFFFDYENNDYGVFAYFSVVYYDFTEDHQCGMLSIDAFNHPAGEFISDNNAEMTGLLKAKLEQLGVFDVLIVTVDAGYNTPTILSRFKNKDPELASQTLYALE
jgi:hypothetical protein